MPKPPFTEAVVEGFKMHRLKSGQSCKRIRSLQARDFADSRANTLDLAVDDPEDCPSLDEIMEVFANLPEIKSPESLHPELELFATEDDDLIAWDDVKDR